MLTTTTAQYPDPLVTANIYYSNHLDDVICDLILPWWRYSASETSSYQECYLWFMRYGRRGEHLKIRAHGPEGAKAKLEETLGEAARRFFAALPAGGEDDGARAGSLDVPPIDDEDRGDSIVPDRDLIWTRYQRSFVTFGSDAYVADDAFAALFSAALAACSDQLLASLDERRRAGSDVNRELGRMRSNALLQLLIAGLGAIGASRERQASYLRYHRDWLIRFPLLKGSAEQAAARSALEMLAARASAAAATVERLGEIARAHRERDPRDRETSSSAAIARLYRYADARGTEPGRDQDPFAPEPAFAVLFKLFHGVANQLGLSAINEALSHHLLLSAIDPEQAASLHIELEPSQLRNGG